MTLRPKLSSSPSMAAPGMEGNLVRQFASRWPNAWADISNRIAYPLAPGNAQAVMPEADCPFTCVLLVSLLGHGDSGDASAQRSLVHSAMSAVIAQAQNAGIPRLAIPVLSGGWRLPPVDAVLSVSDACDAAARSGRRVAVDIHVQDPDLHSTLTNILTGLGW